MIRLDILTEIHLWRVCWNVRKKKLEQQFDEKIDSKKRIVFTQRSMHIYEAIWVLPKRHFSQLLDSPYLAPAKKKNTSKLDFSSNWRYLPIKPYSVPFAQFIMWNQQHLHAIHWNQTYHNGSNCTDHVTSVVYCLRHCQNSCKNHMRKLYTDTFCMIHNNQNKWTNLCRVSPSINVSESRYHWTKRKCKNEK